MFDEGRYYQWVKPTQDVGEVACETFTILQIPANKVKVRNVEILGWA